MLRNLQYYTHMHTHKCKHGSTKVTHKEKLRWFFEDWKQGIQCTWLLLMQFHRKLLDKNREWLWLWWERVIEMYQVDLVAAAKVLHKWSKSWGEIEFLDTWRQNWLWGKINNIIAKIIVQVFLDAPLPKSISKYLALHLITGQIVMKAHCSFLFSR